VFVSINRPALMATRFGCFCGAPVWAKVKGIENESQMRARKGANHFFILVISFERRRNTKGQRDKRSKKGITSFSFTILRLFRSLPLCDEICFRGALISS